MFRTEIAGRLHPAGNIAGTIYMDIWGYTAPDGTELALLASHDAIYFVDVTNPAAPRVVYQFFAPPSTHRDIRTWGHYAYSVNETNSGMQIFDLANPKKPEWVAAFDSTFTRAHNIGIYDGFAYIAGSRQENANAGMRILDLSSPTHPVEVGVYTEFYVHDVFARDNLAYVSNINNARVSILDITDKANPTTVSTVLSGSATHQSWLTDDSRYLLTTHESTGGHLRIWDLQDLENPQFVSSWSAADDATIHNVFVKGDTAYASYYAEGLQVIDISDISNPHMVSTMDTRPTQTSGLNGIWGAYPFASSGLIYCSDMLQGLYVVRLTSEDPQSDFLIQVPEPILVETGGTQIGVVFDVFNGASFAEDFSVSVTNSQGWPMTYFGELHVPQSATEFLAVRIQVPDGLSVPVLLDVELCLTSTRTADGACATTQAATAVFLQDLRVQRTTAGAAQLNWVVQRQAADAQQLLVLRRPLQVADAWLRLAELAWDHRGWVDDQAVPEQAYVYALAQQTAQGVQILAQVTLAVAPPGRGRLLGNQPNPFNPATAIRFQLAHPGEVELRIHDVQGRLVRILQKNVTHTAIESIRWDGRNTQEQVQPSGIYLYSIRSDRWQASGRMMLVR